MQQIRVSIGSVEAGVAKLLSVDDMQMFEVPCRLIPPELLGNPGQIATLTIQRDIKYEQKRMEQVELIRTRLLDCVEDIKSLKDHIENDDGIFTVANVYHDSIILRIDMFDPKEHLITVYSQMVLCNGEEFPITDASAVLSRLSPDTEYHIKLLLKTSDGNWESKEVVVRTREETDLNYALYICDDCKGVEVPSPFYQTADLSSADFLVTNNPGNNATAREAKEKYKIKIVSPDWLETASANGRV